MTALVDTNVLIYATDRDSAFHQQSRDWLTSTLSGEGTVGFAWVAILGFVRIVTNPRIMRIPTTAEFALNVVDDWLTQSGAVVVTPTPNHVSVLRQLLATTGAAGELGERRPPCGPSD